MSTFATRLGVLKGWLIAKDAPQTILNIADEMMANEGEIPNIQHSPYQHFKIPGRTWDDLKEGEARKEIASRQDSLLNRKREVDIGNKSLKKISTINPPVKKNRKSKAPPRPLTKKK